MSDDSSSSSSRSGVRQRGTKANDKSKSSSASASEQASASHSESSERSSEKRMKRIIKDSKKTDEDNSGSTSDSEENTKPTKPAKKEKEESEEKARQAAAPPAKDKGKQKLESSSSESHSGSSSSEKPKPAPAADLKKSTRGGANNKGRDLKKSWKEEDLEIIIPESEGSDESSEDGQKAGADAGAGAAPAGPQIDYFAYVPDEVILKVYGYLDEQMVGRSAQVCQRWNKLTYDDDMWQEKADEWNYIPKAQLTPGKDRSYYVQKYQEQKQRDKSAKDAAERNRKDTIKRDAADVCETMLVLCYFNRIADYISVICLILTTIFATLKLDGAVDWTWRNTLIPIYIPIFQLALTVPSFDLARKTFGTALIDDRPGDKHVVWQFLFSNYRKYRGMTYTVIMTLLMFFLLLIIKLNAAPNGETGIPTGVVLIPLFLLIVVTASAAVTGCGTADSCCDSSHFWDRIFIILGMIAIFIVLLFVSLKLDGVIVWDWYIVLIPLWIVFCLIICMPVTLLCCSCCCDCWEDNSRLLNDKWVFWNICLLCWVFLLAPFLTWFSLIALNLEGDAPTRPWRVIFVPIYLVEALVFAGCILGDVIRFFCN